MRLAACTFHVASSAGLLTHWSSRSVRLAPLSGEAAVEAGSAGVVQVPDPVDRLIIATARDMGATLVTRDRRIRDYAAASMAVRVHDASR